MYVYVFMYTYMYLYVFMCIYEYLCAFMCIYRSWDGGGCSEAWLNRLDESSSLTTVGKPAETVVKLLKAVFLYK